MNQDVFFDIFWPAYQKTFIESIFASAWKKLEFGNLILREHSTSYQLRNRACWVY